MYPTTTNRSIPAHWARTDCMHERTGTCGLFWTLERWEAEAIQEHLVRRLQLQFSGREGELRTALRQLPSLQSLQNASDWRMSDVRVLARFLPVCLRRPYGSGRDPFPSHFAWDPAVLCVNTRVTRFLRSGVFLNYQNKPTPYQNPMKNSWTNRGWFKPIQKKPRGLVSDRKPSELSEGSHATQQTRKHWKP